MPPVVFTARPASRFAPTDGNTALPLKGLREAAVNALFPFRVDAWLQEQRLFFRQLTQLVRAGLPVYQALESAQRSARSLRMKTAVADAVRTVADGSRLSESFARFPESFSEVQVELLRAGETAGHLDRMFELITVQIEKELELRRFLSRQTLYSKIILAFALVVIPTLFSFVFGGDPWRAIVDALASVAELAFLCAVVFSVGRTWLSRSPAAREVYEIAKWRLPGIGPVSRTYALARFGHALSCLYGAGVHLATALRQAGRASASVRISKMAEDAAQAAERGESVLPPMRLSGVVPEETLHLLDTGATTGEVDVMMARAADYLEAEAETRAHKSAYVFSTVVFLIVACYVTGLFSFAGGLLARFVPVSLH